MFHQITDSVSNIKTLNFRAKNSSKQVINQITDSMNIYNFRA